MSASLRNATKRRTHRERAQPSSRKHMGILEKKQDYKERAENYQKKMSRLRILQKKAAERNPDEFYVSMTHSVAGKEIERPEARKSHSEISKLKEEDLRLVTIRKVMDDRKVDKLQAQLHDIQGATTNNEHTFFINPNVPDENTVAQKAISKRQEQANKAPPKDAKKQVRRAYARLEAALERRSASTRALQSLQTERVAMISKGHKRKVKDAQDGLPPVYKWKKQRKK
mmetsp:Transcript_699/g.885  ORF Transcript_699/g.885 Transcript_699/m.885 type:complete len:228 (+) Transcript_699:25-708(+)